MKGYYLTTYLTKWIWILFVIWCIGNSLKINVIKYINMYYLSIILFFGYILFIIADMNIKGEKYELKFYLMNAIIHALPLAILCSDGKKDDKYGIETTLIVFIFYIIYLTYIGKDIVSVYTDDSFKFRSIEDIKIYYKNLSFF